CPHPIKFGDRFQPRMLLLDEETLKIVEEVPIDTMRKLTVEITSLDDLRVLQSRSGDQVRVRASLSSVNVESAAELELGIAAWAKSEGVTLAGTEIIVEMGSLRGETESDTDPEELLRQFAIEDGISNALLDLGLELMQEAKGS